LNEIFNHVIVQDHGGREASSNWHSTISLQLKPLRHFDSKTPWFNSKAPWLDSKTPWLDSITSWLNSKTPWLGSKAPWLDSLLAEGNSVSALVRPP
jgi:hypothetical protein